MMHCKYCGKQIEEDEVCSCQQEPSTKRIPILLISIIGVLIIALVVCIVLLSQGNRSSNSPSVNVLQNSTSDTTDNSDGNNIGNPDNPNTDGGNNDNQNNFTKINPFDFVGQADYYGFEGQGEISIFPDREALVIAIIGDCPETDDEEILAEWLQKFTVYDAAVDDIKIFYSKNINLKNGDTVLVSITAPELLADKVENASKTYIVSGLPVIDYVEIFDDVRISYEGVAGQAFAVVERLSNSELLSSCRFEITPNGNLSNGDQITVSITNKDWLTNVFNVVPKTLSKTFTVAGLAEYIMSANQLPESVIEYYSALSLAETDTSDFFEYSYTTPKIFGVYFMTLKEGKYGYRNVLSVVIVYDEYIGEEYNETVYETYEYMGITVKSTGTFEHKNEKWGKDTNYGFNINMYTYKYEDEYNIVQIL